MTLFDLILIAVSLSMDAFAVSICKGLSVRKVSLQHAMICGVWFGGFQFLMPTLGYFLGDRFATLLTKFGPWIAFVLLGIIGALVLGIGMCMTMIWNSMAAGIVVGIAGIVLLICLIPAIKGIK